MGVSPSMVGQATTVPGGFHLLVPFDFIISTTVANSRPVSPLRCLKLPPSIKLDGVHPDDSSGKRYEQPSISYRVREVVTLVEQGQGQEKICRDINPNSHLLHKEELPSTDTKDFPAEFKLQDSRTIRWSSLIRSLGTMTVSVQEPGALYKGSSTGTSTIGFLDIAVELTGTSDVYQSFTSDAVQGVIFNKRQIVLVRQGFPPTAQPKPLDRPWRHPTRWYLD